MRGHVAKRDVLDFFNLSQINLKKLKDMKISKTGFVSGK